MWEKILEYAGDILAGLVVILPLVIALVKYVKQAVKGKNWTALLTMVSTYMQEAERKFATGAERKEWVMAMVQASAHLVNYDVDMDVVGDLIDSLCAMSKVINVEDKNEGSHEDKLGVSEDYSSSVEA